MTPLDNPKLYTSRCIPQIHQKNQYSIYNTIYAILKTIKGDLQAKSVHSEKSESVKPIAITGLSVISGLVLSVTPPKHLYTMQSYRLL